jgi:hypothetical protein
VMSTFATLLVVPSVFAFVIGNQVASSPSAYPGDPESRHYDPHAFDGQGQAGHAGPEAAHGEGSSAPPEWQADENGNGPGDSHGPGAGPESVH